MDPKDKHFKILFLCTGNSARSIFAEFIMPLVDLEKKFEAYSAGADPKSEVNPMTLKVLKNDFRIDAEGKARSKSWDEFKDVEFDFVITVCDHAKESCPVWPGQPIVAHWGSEDPAAATGSEDEIYQKFRKVAIEIRRRLELLCSFPFEKLDRFRLEQMTKEIGTRRGEELHGS